MIQEGLRVGVFVFLLNTPYYLLCCVPFLHKLRVRKTLLVFMILLTGVLMAVYYALKSTLLPGLAPYHWLVLLVFYVLYLVQYKVYFDITLPKLLYIFMVAQAYSTILNLAGKFIDVAWYPEHVSQIVATSYSLIVLGLMALTYPFLFWFFKGRLRQAFERLPTRSFLLLCIPPALFFVINMLFTNMIQTKMEAPVPELDWESFVLFLLIMVTGFVTYIVTLSAALGTAERVQRENEIQTQLALQAQGYENLTQSIEAARAARHDLRHHMNAIHDFAAREDMTGLKAYLEDYISALPPDVGQDYCQNRAVNVLLRHYLAEAVKAGADIDVKIDLPVQAGIPDADLCVVFGNIFENAAKSVLNQTGEGAFIRARCESGPRDIVLLVQNSVGGSKPGEGLGLKSVAAVAAKCGGTARFTEENGVYSSEIMLII